MKKLILPGLVVFAMGLLCGLWPFSVTSTSSPLQTERTYYCGSAWLREAYGGCDPSDYGILPQASVLFVTVGLLLLAIALVLHLARPQTFDPR